MSYARGLPDFFRAVYVLDQNGVLLNPATEDTLTVVRKTIGGVLGLVKPPSALLSDITISENTTLTNRYLFVNNLTINSGVTLTMPAGSVIFVVGTLTLNGTITVPPSNPGGAGGGGGGAGGKGGSSLIVFAKSVTADGGKLQANGENGGNGTAPSANASGSAGSDSFYPGASVSLYASAPSATTTGGAGGKALNELSLLLIDFIWFGPLLDFAFQGARAAGGGGGAAYTSATTHTGGAGGSLFTLGGASGAGVAVAGASGGGGGAGGLLALLTPRLEGTINLEAKGGNGGNAYSGGSGGGGGSGGLILFFVDEVYGTVNFYANGGAGGLKGPNGGNNGSPGSDGVYLVQPFGSFFEVRW
jgi:hypothetical protein